MRRHILILLAALALILTSCASQTPRKEPQLVSEEVEVIVPSREAVFVYGGAKDLPKRIVLTLSSEPILLPSGYVRLVGVVSGRKNTACLEIGGRGLALREGEILEGFRVIRIHENEIVLRKVN